MNLVHPVILCGGGGTRLWPRSRRACPKPFLPLLGEQTMFEATIARCSEPALFADPLVVTGEPCRELVLAQLSPAANARLVVEPAARNTAPAVALAANLLPPDAIMLVCPSDHHIADVAAFHEATRKAAQLAADGMHVCYGITATRPETGYGYVERGEALGPGFKVVRFIEKPPLAEAEAYLAAGTFSWNGGIFAFRAGALLEELAAQRPEMAAAVAASVAGGKEIEGVFHPDPGPFAEIAGESVDYAVMEGTAHAAMVEADMGWSDIGNWQSLRDARSSETHGADAEGNVVRGRADLLDCRKVMVDSDGPRVSVVGLEDVIVVVDGDEVLVTSASGAANVGKLRGPNEA
ncbi:MAG TPA: sugar phosphate nucleotidyltransferase [Sphingomonadaceae bacterium]|nr:sugar phosphate nucleotidyltransferase [Sphingomonadaceae bacterium]